MRHVNPFSTRGRLGRFQFFAFTLLWNALLYTVLLIGGMPADLGLSALGPDAGSATVLPFLAAVLVAFVATLGYMVRRLHDLEKSGWWALLGLVPLANAVMAVVLLLNPATPGARAENRYGRRAAAF